MKKSFLLITPLLFFVGFLAAQSPDLVWVNSQGGTGFDSGKSIAVDNFGNSYTTGVFTGTADFDPSPNVLNITSQGSYDIFVSKVNVAGQLEWAFGLGSNSSDDANAITIDPNGNFIVVGSFQGTVDFDPSASTNELTSFGQTDVFIAKYDSDGNFIWAKQMGGTSEDIAFGITTDNNGDIYSTGLFMLPQTLTLELQLKTLQQLGLWIYSFQS